MLDKTTVSEWLDAYVHAWKTYNREEIGNLFSENAIYQYGPFQEPIRGRTAIVESWLEKPDAPGTYDGHYAPVIIEGNRAVTRGTTLYFEGNNATPVAEWGNVFFLTFDDEGRCSEFCEWYMLHSKQIE